MAKSESPSSNVMDQVRKLLSNGQPSEAMKILGRNRDASTVTQNARAVCLMRLGQFEDALRILNSLAFPQGGVTMSDDAPLQVKVNHATALLLSGNVAGCQATLGELREEKHPSVERLRQAIFVWRRSQSLWRRLAMGVGVYPFDAHVPLDFPPGEL